MKDGQRIELRRLLLFAVAVLVLSFIGLVYAPALRGAFIWDDHSLLEGDAAYRHASFGHLMTHAFWPESLLSDVRVPYFRPFVLLSYRADIGLGGRPEEFHVTNLLLHLAACAFLGIAAVRAGASYPSALVAMLGWGVFPRLSEAVVWISGRTDVLAAFFGLAALCVWPEIEPAPKRALWARSLLGGLLLFASCASKEVGVAFAIAIAVAVGLRGGTRATLARAGVAVGLPVIVYFALRAAAFAGNSATTRSLGFGRRVGTIFEALGRYGEMVLDPFHSQTSIGILGEVDALRAVSGAFVFVLVCAVTYLVVKRGSFGARIGLVLGGAAIFPVLHILPFTIAGGVTADRLLYVPLAGLAIAVACSLHRAPRWLGGLAIVTSLLFGRSANARAKDYAEETTFWVIAAEHSHPHNTLARMALAQWLLKSVEVEPACKLYERSIAILEVTESAGLAAHRRARESLIGCRTREGRYEDARALATELALAYPDSARALLGVQLTQLHLRDFDGAEASYAKLARVDPAFAAHFAVTPARIARFRAEEANPERLDAIDHADHLAGLGRAPEAAAAFLAIAEDTTKPLAWRQDAAMYLFLEGSFEQAARAHAIVPMPTFDWDTNKMQALARRRRVHAMLAKLAPRIDALTR